MPNAQRKLTRRLVASLKPQLADYMVWDSAVPGFGCRVWPSGTKSFLYSYRVQGQRRMRRVAIDATDVDAARVKVERYQIARKDGRDPAGERQARKERPTVETLGEDYLEHVKTYRKPATAREYIRLWNKHIVPKLGRLIVADVAAADVGRLHRSMANAPYVANRTLALVASFFSFAATQGERAKHENPASDIEPYPEQGREVFLTDKQLGKLGAALEKAEREGLPQPPDRRRKRATGPKAKHRPVSVADVPRPADPIALSALRLLLLTGARKTEVLQLKWSDVDLERGGLTLSDSKSGRSIRPLGAEAVALLVRQPRTGPYVFPGTLPGRPLGSVRRLWDAVRLEAGLDLRLHDLRHTFAATSATRGESLFIVGKMLGHKQSSTTAKYSHIADAALHRAADETSATIARALARTDPTPVTPLQRKA